LSTPFSDNFYQAKLPDELTDNIISSFSIVFYSLLLCSSVSGPVGTEGLHEIKEGIAIFLRGVMKSQISLMPVFNISLTKEFLHPGLKSKEANGSKKGPLPML